MLMLGLGVISTAWMRDEEALFFGFALPVMARVVLLFGRGFAFELAAGRDVEGDVGRPSSRWAEKVTEAARIV